MESCAQADPKMAGMILSERVGVGSVMGDVMLFEHKNLRAE